MDLLVTVARPTAQELQAPAVTSSMQARERVASARKRQQRRLAGSDARCNGEMDVRLVCRHARPDEGAGRILTRAYASGALSARGRHRVLRVARTIADLEGSELVCETHMLTALGLRQRTYADATLVA
jgi:magnesium chelatase family protein